MSDSPTVRLHGVGKCYRLWPNRLDYALDATGLMRFLPARRTKGSDFWSLRGVDLELGRGERLGIVGRNGAGKTTLLKLIVGNVQPTEGTIEVAGTVEALMTTGAGFHPEFTGRENVRASLIHRGLSEPEIREMTDDIVDFTELGDFLDRPFKTYSTGMQARLTFATATCLRPEILIIDEILGAGGAYFIAKSIERIDALVRGSGATVLLVSHDLASVQRFCSTALWLERGRARMLGDCVDVLKGYALDLRRETERRIERRNAARQRDGAAEPPLRGISFLMNVAEPSVRVAALTVECHTGDRSITVDVGAPQDNDPSAEGRLIINAGSTWGAADHSGGREIAPPGGPRSWAYFDLTLSASSPSAVRAVLRADQRAYIEWSAQPSDSPAQQGVWTVEPGENIVEASLGPMVSSGEETTPGHAPISPGESRAEFPRTRWGNHGPFGLGKFALTAPGGGPATVIRSGTGLRFSVEIEAHEIGVHRFAVAFVVYRRDGVTCMQLVSDTLKHDFMHAAQRVCVTTEVAPLRLGPGAYLVSVGLYDSREALDAGDPHALLEAYDRRYEFEVAPGAVWMTSVLLEESRWSLEDDGTDESIVDTATTTPETASPRTLRDEIAQVVFQEGGYPDRWECHPRCPCCQGGDVARRYFAKYGIWHSWCRGCDFVFVDPCPPNELLDRLYNGAYYNAVRELIEASRARKDPGDGAIFSVPIELFDNALRHMCRDQVPGSWLDVGGGIGSFAWRVRSQLADCDVRLHELNALSRRLSAEIYGLRPAETGRRFDCVSMLSVLEHCPEPARMLEEAAAWVQPGGRLLIYVPRFSPLCRTVAKGSCVNVIPPFHASLFDQRSMEALLTRCPSIASYEITIEGPPAFSPLYLVDYGDHWDIEVPTVEGQEIRSIQIREYDATTAQVLNLLAVVGPRLDEFLAEVDGGVFLRVIARVQRAS